MKLASDRPELFHRIAGLFESEWYFQEFPQAQGCHGWSERLPTTSSQTFLTTAISTSTGWPPPTVIYVGTLASPLIDREPDESKEHQ